MRGEGLYLLAYVQPGVDVLAERADGGTACFVGRDCRHPGRDNREMREAMPYRTNQVSSLFGILTCMWLQSKVATEGVRSLGVTF